ncbi:hypothetical protein [Paenibacillus flagellatus]|uniref:Uncharacterized protein n=1 Tax=Paenibacillus flagellatus TaxID=2211139 RepID=A0A2V5KEW3_9BACL|nr:hypothetical protein [Paenibacillus flagellatus]PYI52570.1 hypothetical protein DLM86_20570 [Paenibacillus flagellatus]
MNERSRPVHPQQPNEEREAARKEWSDARRETGAAHAPDTTVVPAARVVYIPRRDKYKRRWYNQGWLWMIVAFAALIVLVAGFMNMSQQAGQIADAVNGQTEAIREQTGALGSIEAGLDRINETVRDGFDRLARLIGEAVQALQGS